MTKRPTLISLILSCALTLCAGLPALANEPDRVVQAVVNEMTSALQANQSEIQSNDEALERMVRRIVFPHVDFTYMTRLVLDEYWHQAQHENKLRPFHDGLQNHVYSVYHVALKSYNGEEIEVTGSKLQDPAKVPSGHFRKAIVQSKIFTDNNTFIVDYLMHHNNQGWKVYDIRVDGIGFIKSFKASIQSSIKRNGLDKTIARLHEF